MVKLEGKKLKYQAGGRTILQDISFSFTTGAWITVVGHSGTGKSTLLKLIAGLEELSSGEILLDDQNALDYEIGAYRQQVSYATQSAQLFGQTVRENLDLPYQVRGLKPDEEEQVAGLMQMDLPAEYLDKAVSELSGGERQRVGVLRNLLFPPKVLLLDEISTGLDAETKAIIWQAIHKIHKTNQGIVMSVTHDEGEISHATETLTIADGKGILKNEFTN